MSPASRFPDGVVVPDEPHERPSNPPGPVERLSRQRLSVSLPCEGCLHAPVCGIRRDLLGLRIEALIPPVDLAVRLTGGQIVVECAYLLPKAKTRSRPKDEAAPAAATEPSDPAPSRRDQRAPWTPEKCAAQAERMRAVHRRQREGSA